MTRFEAYQQAVSLLDQAQPLIDEARTLLKSARVEVQAGGYRHPDIRELGNDLESLIEYARRAECEDCNTALVDCKCAWLHQEAKL